MDYSKMILQNTRRCMRITGEDFEYCNLRRSKQFQIRLKIATKFRIPRIKTDTMIFYHERWFFSRHTNYREMGFSQQTFVLARFFHSPRFTRPLFLLAHLFYSPTFFFTRPQILQYVCFCINTSLKIMTSDLSYCQQTVSRICDESKRLQSDGSNNGFCRQIRGKIAVGGLSASDPSACVARKQAKTPEGGMFSSTSKTAWVRLHLVPIALFYTKKVL